MTAEEYEAQKPPLNVMDSSGFITQMAELHREVLEKQPKWIGE